MDSVSCSICLDLLKSPVTLPCGHSYCMDCIHGCWDKDDQRGVYSCPHCRQTFSPKPVLNTSMLLVELMEKLKNTRLEVVTDPPSPHDIASFCPQSYAVPGDVECDFCTGRKLKAAKSCLVCLASYCEIHIKSHYDVAPLKKHKLINAKAQLQDHICPHHNKLLEVYCRTDQQCVCLLCVMDDHRGHDTVSVSSERTERQKQLTKNQDETKQEVREREKQVEELKECLQTLKHSTQEVVEDSEKMAAELISCVERRLSDLKELITAQEVLAVTRGEKLLKFIEEEMAKLKRKEAELEELSHTDDHIHFFQKMKSITLSSGSEAKPNITTKHPYSFEKVKTSLSELKEKVGDVLKEEMAKTSEKVVKAFHPPHGPVSDKLFCFGEPSSAGNFSFSPVVALDKDEDMPKPAKTNDIKAEPVTPILEKVGLSTSEENEVEVYSQRVKLYRFDTSLSEWKESGIGKIKLLKHKINGRLRVLMKRALGLTVCANHHITTTIVLKPIVGSDKTWTWAAMDYSDEVPKNERFVAQFPSQLLAEEFKLKLEECQKTLQRKISNKIR